MSFPAPFFKWRPHPWHGLDVGPDPPRLVYAYIELTPYDRVKYELDKQTGYLRVDRPNRTSSFAPTLYGFIPKTYCGERVKAMMPGAKTGDGDPLDICVISERPINVGEVILKARVVGGLPMLDNHEADDKIIAILDNDAMWEGVQDVSHLPVIMVNRLRHYFSTYKMLTPDDPPVKVGEAYSRDHAEQVIEAALADYAEQFGE
ncbi:inorganic pyrophosphatase [Bythopirellula polymerisocia]|uniref:inorganic diphosphatase n=1 Tax=Bythopirellula polymerisocia TaxID=2528003 RepID=A0A5C6CJU4_9BACT|nr:inorganic pyrophosphatase [Bythopirellula polymerisocia]TWU24642.1 Inorganic pyrophosphatase [Bythopirellula polymerisocia]